MSGRRNEGERMDLFPAKYNAEYFAAMANALIKGKHSSMGVREALLLRFLITQIVKEDGELKTYTVHISELARLLDFSQDSLYRDIQKICNKLMKQVVLIQDSSNPAAGKWTMFHWVSRAQYDGNGILQIRLSDELKPYLLGLSKLYTQYKFQEVLLSSFYSIRLYELIRCDIGLCDDTKDFHEYDIAYLRQYFDCENKYKTTSIFILRTITAAVDEINEKTTMDISYELVKGKQKGNPISGIRFEVFMHPSMKMKEKMRKGREESQRRLQLF